MRELLGIIIAAILGGVVGSLVWILGFQPLVERRKAESLGIHEVGIEDLSSEQLCWLLEVVTDILVKRKVLIKKDVKYRAPAKK